mgnify:CR=1 FL=1
MADSDRPVYKQVRDEAGSPDMGGPELPSAPTSLIGYTVVMKGELVAGEDVVIEGTFDGAIVGESPHSITVRRIARISGEVTASNVRVEDGTDLQKAVLSGRIRLADD